MYLKIGLKKNTYESRRRAILAHNFFQKLKRKKRKKRSRRSKPADPNPNRIQNIHRRFRRQSRKTSLSRKKRHNKYKIVAFPKNFSFLNNTDNLLLTLEKARKHFKKGQQVFFDLSFIEKLTPETIALYVALMKDERFHRGENAQGNVPRKPELTKVFFDSGFFQFVKSTTKIPYTTQNLLINKITEFKVENETAKEACINAVKNTFENEKKFRPIYEILIECMANTKNHADAKGEEGKFNWWLFEYNDPVSKISTFTFLDLGIGIFNSLPVQNFMRDITNSLRFTTNADLVPKLVAGEITSKTGLKERGLGLPLIYKHSKNPYIRNFIIISNDVKANLETDENKKLKYNFGGTLLYWELHPQPKTNK